MFLHRVQIDTRCREARRDLADPYQMHATLCRAFHDSDEKCPPGTFLWRLEPRSSMQENPFVLVQGRQVAQWDRIGIERWLAKVDPALDLKERLRLGSLAVDSRYRFRLQANPSVTRNGKRLGLLRSEAQRHWLERKGNLHGFAVLGTLISEERMIEARKHGGQRIAIFSARFDGLLRVTDAARFTATLSSGVGRGKALGLGLLSIAPVT